MSARGNESVAAAVLRTRFALGYVQYGVARDVGLGMASLQNHAGNYIAPNGTSGLETLLQCQLPPDLLARFPDPQGEHSYPLVTFTWMLLRPTDDQEKTEKLKAFVHWCLASGQDFSEAAGNVRLAPHVVRASEKALQSLGRAAE